ncbi:MAG: hypothetical protein UY50_C0015G0004 [Parcubacteria group bacterium GW2011_GWA2_49_9]|nr:MAG: hypothetical protein UY50_C0015G0004 [Parcubacteria group bacterium GW2011_GWA2_49_9]
MLTKIAAWIRNPARAFREQTWNQEQINLEFLRAKYGKWFTDLPPEAQIGMTHSFMGLQRNRIWVVRNVLITIFGFVSLVALFFLKR